DEVPAFSTRAVTIMRGIAIATICASCFLWRFRIARCAGSETLPPSFGCCPAGQFRNRLGPLAVIQVNPRPSEVIEISPEAEARASPLERLCLSTRAGIFVIGPLFSGSRVRAQPEDRKFTGDQHLRND